MSTEKIKLIVPESNNLERIDVFIVHALEHDVSRSYIQKLIKGENIAVNGSFIKANYKVKTDDEIEITFPEPTKLELLAQDIPLTILYQDSSLVVLNKQPGLVVHPGPGNWDKTLVNALLFHIKDLSSIGGVERPGIVHRLDKDTAGLMIVAKNDRAHRGLVTLFSTQQIHKEYTAIVVGKPQQEHMYIDIPIGRHPKYRHKMTTLATGKEAKTEFFLEKVWRTKIGIFSLLRVRIHTGRTHQIRVHLSSQGIPIVGDPIYSKKWEKYRVPYLLLAATSLSFTHPENQETMNFSIDPPSHIIEYMEKLERLSE